MLSFADAVVREWNEHEGGINHREARGMHYARYFERVS